jgi:hypothetical protein
MVSEGVDIPRLRVGVYATNTITDLFFRQAVGRLVRWTGASARQTAYMFIPDDARLRTFAGGIAEQRRHSLRRQQELEDEQGQRRRKDDDGGGEIDDPRELEIEVEGDGADGQLSLFSAISAVPLDDHGRRLDGVRVYDDAQDDAIPDLVVAPGDGDGRPGGAGSSAGERRLPLLSEAGGGAAPVPLPDPDPLTPAGAPQTKISALARRRQLREQNSAAVTDLAHSTGKSHATLNADLNRRAGIRRISEATVRQLEKRLELAKGMMRRISI